MPPTTTSGGTKPPTAKRPQPSARRESVNRPAGASERSSSGGSNPAIGRRGSVHFTVDKSDTGGAKRQPTSGRAGDVEFKRSMNDFLNVMYGDKTAGDKSAPKSAHLQVPSSTAGKPSSTAATSAGTNRASQYRAAASAAPKGPLVKGVPAGQANLGGDNIDSLVSHLVRAYSRSTTPASGFHDDTEAPISYGGAGGAVSARPRRHTGSQLEITAFVSQAMDSFFVPHTGSGALSSKRSMLSSLGMDQNFEKLLSFHPNSNVVEDDEEETPVVPMYIGGMATFNPGGNDVSVSKSMPMGTLGGARSVGAAAPAARSTAAPNARRANMNMSLNSAVGPSGRPTTGAVAGRRALGRSGGLHREMSLDSKAIGGVLGNKDDNDDSWADVDAAAVAEAIKNTAASSTKAPLVSNTRSLMTMSRTKADAELNKKLKALADEETLSRNVLLAVEHQLRGYIEAAHTDESKKATQRRVSSAAKKR